jgi:hypothetical protein
MKPLRLRRSQMVKLVLLGTTLTSGVILTGCDRSPENSGSESSASTNGMAVNQNQMIRNNTFVPGRGYYHARYFRWYPYPYDYYVSGRGYYRGGYFYSDPDDNPPEASNPETQQGGSSSGSLTHGGSIGVYHAPGTFSDHVSSSSSSIGEGAEGTSHGGFGGSAHGSGGE